MDAPSFEAFLATQMRLSPSSRAKYTAIAKRWGDSDPVAWLANAGIEHMTNGAAYPLIGAVRWYCHWKGITFDADKLPRPRTRQQEYRDALSDDELAAYNAAIIESGMNEPYRTILSILSRTGLRVSEACALERSRMLARGATWGINVLGKGHEGVPKERFVPFTRSVHGDLLAYFRSHKPQGRWVFPSPQNQNEHVSAGAVRDHLERVRRQLKFGHKVTPHVLRHTFATRLLNADVPLATVQALMGHADITTTARYLHPDVNQLRSGVDAGERGYREGGVRPKGQR